jgi:hypothetical protein
VTNRPLRSRTWWQGPRVQAAVIKSLLSQHRVINLLPRQHLVDSAYVSADELVASQSAYSVDLLGPIHGNGWWQAKADQGYDLDSFHIDWQAQTATCPQGKTSIRWNPSRTPYGPPTSLCGLAHLSWVARGQPAPRRASRLVVGR